VEAQEEPGEKRPSQFVSLPSTPCFFITSIRHQHQGGEHHPVGGDDQRRCIAELDEDGSGGDRYDSNGKKYIKTIHLD
jgi:hypothetical protein